MWINVEFHPLLLSTNFSQVRIHLAKLLSCGWPTVDRTNRRPTRDKVLAANLILGVMWARGCCWLTLAAAEEVCLDGAMASVMSGSGENISSLKKRAENGNEDFSQLKTLFCSSPDWLVQPWHWRWYTDGSSNHMPRNFLKVLAPFQTAHGSVNRTIWH